jgi:metal-sulfur cluster biosynthetic enzyme
MNHTNDLDAGDSESDPQDSAVGIQHSAVVAGIWQALREVEDPEIPVSLVDMGLIVAVDFDPPSRTARLTITYTAMGCPAMEMIQDDIRRRVLREPRVEAVEIDVVWDPVWTRKRLSESARAAMRELGIAV